MLGEMEKEVMMVSFFYWGLETTWLELRQRRLAGPATRKDIPTDTDFQLKLDLVLTLSRQVCSLKQKTLMGAVLPINQLHVGCMPEPNLCCFAPEHEEAS